MITLPRFLALAVLVSSVAPHAASAQTLQALQAAQMLPDGSNAANSGTSVAIQGTRSVAGIPGMIVSGFSNCGGAVVTERLADGTWGTVATLTAADKNPGSRFGESVALDGDRVICGEPYYTHTGESFQRGAAYIYERQPSAAWLQKAKLLAPDGANTDDQFGISVAIQGDLAIVGAYDNSNSDGAVYLYERDGLGVWNFSIKLIGTGIGPLPGKLGTSVAISGSLLIAGAPNSHAPFTNPAGAAFIYEKVAAVWIEVAIITPSDLSLGDEFGGSVAIDGTRVAVASRFDDDGGPNTGSVYIFERQPDLSWLQTAKINASDTAAFDEFGRVALKGNRLAVGAAKDDTPVGVDGGSVYLFEYAAGSWTQKAKIVPKGAGAGDLFGTAVAIDSTRLTVGSPNYHGFNIGSAYVYRLVYDGAVSYGTGTPGCLGTQTLETVIPPEIGATQFQLVCDTAPSFALGACIITDVPDIAGTDVFSIGVLMHNNFLLSVDIFSFDMYSALGNVSDYIAIPADPFLVGLHYYGQAIWQWSECSLPPHNLSGSRGLNFTILAP